MRPLTLCFFLLLLVLSAWGQANKKKFGGPGGKDKDYAGPASSDGDYDGQDDSYYEDYEGEKSSPSPKTTEKPKLTSPSSHDKDGKAGTPSLFGPRRTRKPFTPKFAERARATLPSFIRHPANPSDLTTVRSLNARPTLASLTTKSAAGTTKSSGSVIRATTARPNRFKTAGNDRSRPTSATATGGGTDNTDGNRRYGGAAGRNNNKNARNTFRQAGGAN